MTATEHRKISWVEEYLTALSHSDDPGPEKYLLYGHSYQTKMERSTNSRDMKLRKATRLCARGSWMPKVR